jgi:hypothetical protein
VAGGRFRQEIRGFLQADLVASCLSSGDLDLGLGSTYYVIVGQK